MKDMALHTRRYQLRYEMMGRPKLNELVSSKRSMSNKRKFRKITKTNIGPNLAKIQLTVQLRVQRLNNMRCNLKTFQKLNVQTK